MDTHTFTQFRELIYRECGIHLSDEKLPLLSNRINKRLRALGLGDESDYLQILQLDKSGTELINLIDVVSTNTTYFYREAEHFGVLSKIFQNWDYSLHPKVRLWCAASSSGEEPYTLAITALENLQLDKLDFKIIATDISTRVIDQAVRGQYVEKQLEKLPASLRQKYFRQSADTLAKPWEVKEEVKDLVIYRRFNLAEFPYALKTKIDIIFCRNVMIYFDLNVRQKVIAEFERLLKPDGYLFLSRSENLLGIQHNLQTIDSAVYKKKLKQ